MGQQWSTRRRDTQKCIASPPGRASRARPRLTVPLRAPAQLILPQRVDASPCRRPSGCGLARAKPPVHKRFSVGGRARSRPRCHSRAPHRPLISPDPGRSDPTAPARALAPLGGSPPVRHTLRRAVWHGKRRRAGRPARPAARRAVCPADFAICLRSPIPGHPPSRSAPPPARSPPGFPPPLINPPFLNPRRETTTSRRAAPGGSPGRRSRRRGGRRASTPRPPYSSSRAATTSASRPPRSRRRRRPRRPRRRCR